MSGPHGKRARRPHPFRPALWAAGFAAFVGFLPGARAQEISEEARKHFRAGVNNLQDPEGERFEEAYIEFKRAYEISKSPNILGNLGYCAMRLERDGEALDAYALYLSSATNIKPDEREQIERDLQTLSASAVRLTVTADVKEATIVDTRHPVRGATVTNRYPLRDGKAEFIVRAGHHIVRLQTEGVDRGQWQFDALGGASQAKHFTVGSPPEPKPSARSAPVLPWVLVGVGGAALAGGAVTGVLTLRGVSDLEDRCPNDECPADSGYEAKKRSTKTFAIATDALLIGGGLAAAVGAGWLIFGAKGGSKGASSGSVTGGAACTPSGCAALLRTHFLERLCRMRRTPWLPRALAATLLATSGCTAVADVDRFQAPLEDKDNNYRSLDFTVSGMTTHIAKYFELRLVDGDNWVQFLAVSERFEDEAEGRFFVPNVVPKRLTSSYRLDFFGDMNGDGTFNFKPVLDPNDATKELFPQDHSWRIDGLDGSNEADVDVGGRRVGVSFVHNQEFKDLDQPAGPVIFRGGDAVVSYKNLEPYLNKRLEVRILSAANRKYPRTLGLYRIPKLLSPTGTFTLPGLLREPELYTVTAYIDANGDKEYDNPAEGGPDLGWKLEVQAQSPSNDLTVTFDPTTAGPSNVDVDFGAR